MTPAESKDFAAKVLAAIEKAKQTGQPLELPINRTYSAADAVEIQKLIAESMTEAKAPDEFLKAALKEMGIENINPNTKTKIY